MLVRVMLAAGVCAAVMVAAGPPREARAAGEAEVSVRLFQFRPGAVSAAPGATVTWVNRDDIEHTVTGGAPELRDPALDLALEGKDATAARRFDAPGVYPYFCARHPHMRGEVRIR